MRILALVCPVVAMAVLSGCGTNQGEIRDKIRTWKGQTETALTSTFGYPQKTIDLQGGNKVYHYGFDKNCAIDFEINTKSIVSDVKPSGSNLDACPHKLPGGGTY